MRIALGVEYNGANYRGWQTQQPGVASVQAALEQGLSRIASSPVQVVCAGRTDAGVHARGQVVHFNTVAQRPQHAWVLGTNTVLPADIAVLWAREVDADFHARFTCEARHYRYVVHNRLARPGLWRDRVTWIHHHLEVAPMQAGARLLLGEHDFSSFRAAACQARHGIREVQRLEVRREGEFVVMDVVANAFVHHMVRNIAGVLIAVGSGLQAPEWVGEVLAARDRTQGGVTADAAGLYFMGTRYPERYGIAWSGAAEFRGL